MKTKLFSNVVLIVFAILFMTGCNTGTKKESKMIPVKIGWQIPLATQGQIVQVMKKTNVLDVNGIEGDFVSFSYGGPQSEAALSGELDFIFIGDQPAVNLIAKGGKWKIVSRLFYTKTAIMVPLNSTIKEMKDFKGKTLASPFGSVAHREAILKEQFVGLNADQDVNNTNLDILEISNVVQSGGDKTWGKIDGVGVWEPSTSLFETTKLARIVDFTNTLGVIAVSEDFINKYPEAVTNFLTAVIESWQYFATHQQEVNKWYIDDARLSYSPDVLSKASSIEPNMNAKSINEIDLSLSPDNIQTLNIAAKWSYERGYSNNVTVIDQAIDQTFLINANKFIKDKELDGLRINIKK